MADLMVLWKKRMGALTGSKSNEGLYLRSSVMTNAWPLWAALNNGVAPS